MHYSVIVCFNPNIGNLVDLTKKLTKSSSKVILVDNTPKSYLKENIEGLEEAEMIILNNNLGIGRAQNIGINHANECRAHTISFFDQDSMIAEDSIELIIKSFIDKNNNIISIPPVDSNTKKPLPLIRLNRFGLPYKLKTNHEEAESLVDIVISSGTSVRSEILEIIGPFDESLFIDGVDTDWCLRSRNKGFAINMMKSVTMEHSIGDSRKAFGPLTLQSHSPERCYYQIRNSFLLMHKTYVPFLFSVYEIISNITNRMLLLFYVEDKMRYLKCILYGVIDGIKKKSGPIEI